MNSVQIYFIDRVHINKNFKSWFTHLKLHFFPNLFRTGINKRKFIKPFKESLEVLQCKRYKLCARKLVVPLSHRLLLL